MLKALFKTVALLPLLSDAYKAMELISPFLTIHKYGILRFPSTGSTSSKLFKV